jgi:hypothetical protein
MNKLKCMVRTSGLAVAVVLAGSLSAKAAITLQLLDATSRAETGFTTAGTAGATIVGNELIGIYRFTASGSGGPVNPFWSTCLSPAGNLDWGQHAYTSLAFGPGTGTADSGHNPQSWSTVGAPDSGIQNAQYLWRLFSPTIIASGTADQGAGLALAMYEALYDSTGYGMYNAAVNSGNFYVTAGLSGGVLTAYNSYLSILNTASSAASVTANLANGYVLRDANYVATGVATPGAGQDLIWNVTPVPEPTTMIAGAMLLLPFGLQTVRHLRKRKQTA